MLTQKEDGGDELPISFMSTGLQGAELNYPTMDKQAYAVFKVVKQFRPYILKNRTKVIVPHPAVRSLFIKKELGERRGNWVIALQEYDLEFKPASIVKGQGLCKIMTESMGKGRIDLDHGKVNNVLYVLVVASNLLSVYQMTGYNSTSVLIVVIKRFYE